MSEMIFEQNPELRVLSEKLLQARIRGELLLQSGDVGWASAPSNIALLKYWGKKSGLKQIPVNSSLSLTLGAFRAFTQISVVGRFFPLNEGRVNVLLERPHFSLELNQNTAPMPAKMEIFLKSILHGFADDIALRVESVNNFPTACGVASSAAGYAAIVGAIADLLNLQRFLNASEMQTWLCEWSRLGSGSATRSAISQSDLNVSQFVAWELLDNGVSSRTQELPVHKNLSELCHCVLVLDAGEKSVGSSKGHTLAQTSLFQELRLAQYPARFLRTREALLKGDFQCLQELTEIDAFEMHAVMATGSCPLNYMNRDTASAISKFVEIRNKVSAKMLWTLDAGANPHFVFMPEASVVMSQFFQLLNSDPRFSGAKVLSGETNSKGLYLGEKSGAKSVVASSKLPDVLKEMSLLEAAQFFLKGSKE